MLYLVYTNSNVKMEIHIIYISQQMYRDLSFIIYIYVIYMTS